MCSNVLIETHCLVVANNEHLDNGGLNCDGGWYSCAHLQTCKLPFRKQSSCAGICQALCCNVLAWREQIWHQEGFKGLCKRFANALSDGQGPGASAAVASVRSLEWLQEWHVYQDFSHFVTGDKRKLELQRAMQGCKDNLILSLRADRAEFAQQAATTRTLKEQGAIMELPDGVGLPGTSTLLEFLLMDEEARAEALSLLGRHGSGKASWFRVLQEQEGQVMNPDKQ